MDVIAFADNLYHMPITAATSYKEAQDMMTELPFGNTNISLPFVWAADKQRDYDVFIVLTDNETNAFGYIKPAAALQQYRRMRGVSSKLIVCAFAATSFTVADPRDRGMFDFAGLDSALP